MKLKDLLAKTENLKPYQTKSPDSRRDILVSFFPFLKKAIAGTGLFSVALGIKTAKAQNINPAVIFDRLNFLLTLELTQLAFYQRCQVLTNADGTEGYLTAFSALPFDVRQGIILMAADQQNHVNLLIKFFSGTNTPVTMNTFGFDFKINGNLPDLDTNPLTLLLLGQILEDLSVRCYKGMIQKFTGNSNLRALYLPAILGLHSIEARHAGYIRLARRKLGQPVTPWVQSFLVPDNPAGIPSHSTQINLFNNIYIAEDNTNQAQINLIGINGHQEISNVIAAESFDEILTQAQGKVILKNIIISGLN